VYSTTNTRPTWPPASTTELNADEWKEGEIITAGEVQWFSFEASTTAQYIHLDTQLSLSVQLYDSDGSTVTITESLTCYTIAVIEGDKYYIRVSSTETGTYKIAVSESDDADDIEDPSDT
jgi:uncharacterized membrane protein (UPF0127 family)